jgi:hypothetical protein
MMPAIPEALTAANREIKGDGDERISSPPITDGMERR